MAANEDRGECEIQFSKDNVVTLRFRYAETTLLGERLGCDPLIYLGRGGSIEAFLTHAIIAGTSQIRRQDRVTPGKIALWFDHADPEFSREDAQKRVLYAVARGKGGGESEKMLAQLDEIFAVDDPKKNESASGNAKSKRSEAAPSTM
jgi:hypothetical protein